MKKEESFKQKTITTPDGRTITYFDGKLHSWESPAIKYPSESKQKNEYFLYGIPYTKDEWLEARRDRNGVPPHKQISVREKR